MTVLQVGQYRRNEGLEEFLLTNTAKEAQCDATDVLVGVLKVVPKVLTDEDLRDMRAR